MSEVRTPGSAHVPGFFSRLIIPAIVFAALFAALPANASEPSDKPPRDGVADLFKDIEKFGEKVHDETVKAQINLSPVLRQIVCRVAYEPFTRGELGRAMGISDEEIGKGLEKLNAMNLVLLEKGGGGGLVLPASDSAQDLMQRWAEEWCVNDDTCGVAK